jgi:hypothetical protein
MNESLVPVCSASAEPVSVVPAMIAQVLEMAQSWTNWDGVPVEVDGRVMTPNKAIRRVTDHVIDHLAEAQSRINGVEPLVDRWHHSAHTTASDLALFTEPDLNEAIERLTRLAQLWTLTYRSIGVDRLDARVPDAEHGAMTLRELAEHAGESVAYANAIGTVQPS